MELNDFSKSEIIAMLTLIVTTLSIVVTIIHQRSPAKLAKKQLDNLNTEKNIKPIPKLNVSIQSFGINDFLRSLI